MRFPTARHSRLAAAILLALLAGCQRAQVSSLEEDAAGTSPAAASVQSRTDALAAAAEGDAAAADAAIVVGEIAVRQEAAKAYRVAPAPMALASAMAPPPAPMVAMVAGQPEVNTEHYATVEDNPVHRVVDDPVSTFSIDVDTGSYSNVRRMLLAGTRPPRDAVRAEEMLNYFDYGYAAPTARTQPFSITTERAIAPWNPRRQLLQVGLQGYRVPASAIPPTNLVFLIDTSGSMQDPDKLPLLKRSFAELAERLRPQDRVSIVVYAGSAGLVLAPTPGDRKSDILGALDALEAGGSTNGGEGIALAYATARRAFLRDGINRVVLATDGDFNVGTVDQKALETLVADQRESGIALSTLGFGAGNYDDAMAERLADVGNGNHAYVDSLAEARKVLVEEAGGTLMTIAQDVKIQVEFNPAVVAEYRLIGYENRALRREDFDNDKVDAGEIGAGHDVTALYEVTLVGSGGEANAPLRYGKSQSVAQGRAAAPATNCELAWLRLRYKLPGAGTSKLVEQPVACGAVASTPTPRLRWAAAVAAYADLLRGGQHVGSFGWPQVRALAEGARGADADGRRGEFVTLVDRAQALTTGTAPVAIAP
jgi:Ca-activated chloride channel family protein